MLGNFIKNVESQGLRVRGIEVYQHGRKVAAHRWAPNYRYPVHSVSKSFTSAAIGMLVDAGRLCVDEKVVDIFPESVPKDADENLLTLTVENLLTMQTGHTVSAHFDPEAGYDMMDGVEYFMSVPFEKKPGTFFFYDNGSTYVLSSIVTKITGESTRDFLKPRLFDILGINNPVWEESPTGNSLGYTGLFLNTTELAQLGKLHLNYGVYNGKRILSEEWIKRSGEAISDTTPHIDGEDNKYGYGYQFWGCEPRAKAYRADGYLGQFIVISHELNAVIAVSSWDTIPQRILTAMWDDITPELEKNN